MVVNENVFGRTNLFSPGGSVSSLLPAGATTLRFYWNPPVMLYFRKWQCDVTQYLYQEGWSPQTPPISQSGAVLSYPLVSVHHLQWWFDYMKMMMMITKNSDYTIFSGASLDWFFSLVVFIFWRKKTLRILQSFNNSVEADGQLLTVQIKYLFPIKQSVNIYLTIRQTSQKNDTILPVVPAWSWILRCCYIAMSTDEMLHQWRQWETMFDFVLI